MPESVGGTQEQTGTCTDALSVLIFLRAAGPLTDDTADGDHLRSMIGHQSTPYDHHHKRASHQRKSSQHVRTKRDGVILRRG